MGRLFSCFLLSLMLLPAPKMEQRAQPAFFSLLFPQLMPGYEDAVIATPQEAAPGEAVLM